MPPLICLFGPHAVGKTTAAKRYIQKYSPLLTVALADVQLEYDGETETRVKQWKGTFEEKRSALESARTRTTIMLVESCSSYGTQLLRSLKWDDEVIHVFCSPQTLYDNLKRRADKLGKKFNGPYWDRKRLVYESRERLTNCARRCVRPDKYKEFRVDNYETDWPAVDDYFGSVFRRLHNSIRRDG